jgi:hypothetical protein
LPITPRSPTAAPAGRIRTPVEHGQLQLVLFDERSLLETARRNIRASGGWRAAIRCSRRCARKRQELFVATGRDLHQSRIASTRAGAEAPMQSQPRPRWTASTSSTPRSMPCALSVL